MKAKNHSSNPGAIVGQKRRRKPVVRKTTDRLQKRIEPHTQAGMLPVLPVSDEKLQKYFHIFVLVILLAFGSFISIRFYGHQVVPNSDFPSFSQTAREIFSFKPPSSFKRTPGLGMLHVMASYLMPGAHPVLTAGWVLNTVFHALTAVLLYLVGRELVGYSAIWYALLMTVNPWVIAWMTHPLAETPLIFFVLLTFYLTFKHSRWSYAAAMMASMIRYEGAAMIAIAFVGDIIHSKTWRPILWAFLVSIPLFLATLLQIIPTLATVLKIPLPEFSTLYNLMRFAIVFPFFAAGVVYLIVYRKLRWAYLPAGIASLFSLLAGVILIVAVFSWDLYKSGVWGKTLPRLLLVILASLPIALWFYGTKQARIKNPGAKDYSKDYTPAKKMVIGEFSDYVWQLGVSSYFVDGQAEMPIPGMPNHTRTVFTRVTKPSRILFVLCVISALGYAIYKKHVPALLVFSFLAVYFLAHATRNGTRLRYGIPIAWVSFLIAWYGLKHFWLLLQTWWKIPRTVSLGLQLLLIPAVLVWFTYLPKISTLERYNYYSIYRPIPYVAITVIVLLFLARFLAYRGRTFVKDLALSMLVCLMLISNQFILTSLVGNGSKDSEFKNLATWYRKNAAGEKMVVSLPPIISLYAPKYEQKFVHTSKLTGVSFNEFISNCYNHTISYITWDSRLGYATNDSYYKKWGIGTLWPLVSKPNTKPKDFGPCLYQEQIGALYSPIRLINIFRLDYAPLDALASWIRNHTQPGEKVLTTFCSALAVKYFPERKKDFVHYAKVYSSETTSHEQWIQNCRQAGITYVVWDSVIGSNFDGRYYKEWGMEHVAELGKISTLQDLHTIPPDFSSGGFFQYQNRIFYNDKVFLSVFQLLPAKTEEPK